MKYITLCRAVPIVFDPEDEEDRMIRTFNTITGFVFYESWT